MKTTIQRLRNLTTGIIHTEIGHVYEDLGAITGETGLMTHMLPRLFRATQPWLKKVVTDDRFWNDKWDKAHTGEIELPEPTEADREEMRQMYALQADPLAGKEVIVVTAP